MEESQETLLLPGQEKILWTGTPSYWSYSPYLFLAGILLYAFGAGLLLFLAIFLYRNSRFYTVTAESVSARHGLFRKQTDRILLDDIATVQLDSPALPIVAGVADVIVRSKNGDMLRLDSVYPAREIQKLLLRMEKK